VTEVYLHGAPWSKIDTLAGPDVNEVDRPASKPQSHEEAKCAARQPWCTTLNSRFLRGHRARRGQPH